MSTPRLRAVHPDHAELVHELERLRKRGIHSAFTRLDKQGPIQIRILSRIAEGIRPELWRADKHVEALVEILNLAIGELPAAALRGAPPNSEVTWQDAARIMFQTSTLPLGLSTKIAKEYGSQRYAQLARYVQDLAGLEAGDESIKVVNKELRQEIATILLAKELQMSAGRHASSVNSEDGDDLNEVDDQTFEVQLSEPTTEKPTPGAKYISDFRHSKGAYHGDYGTQINFNL